MIAYISRIYRNIVKNTHCNNKCNMVISKIMLAVIYKPVYLLNFEIYVLIKYFQNLYLVDAASKIDP